MTPTPRKSSEIKKSLSLKEIARLVNGEIVGNPDITVTGVAGIKEANEGDISFISNAKYLPFLDQTRASAVIAAPDVVSKSKTLIRCKNPSQAFTKVILLFKPARKEKAPGVHGSAVIHPTSLLGKNVFIGPNVVVEEGVTIGDGSIINANVFIGAGCQIGQNVQIYPNVTLREETVIGDRVIIHSGSVIGSDGFGYETIDGEHHKIPHTGSVLIEDDVEIGANVCVDRGRFQRTWIKKGVKIDNLVQIAHNVVIGPHSLLISQSGISGSTELGKNVILAGQAGVVGHVTLGDGVIVGAGAGVTKSIPENTVVLGSPAKPISEQKRIFALIGRLPELFKEFAELKKNLTKDKV
jgi:UDP-3-O-[3-hydroxymyristoyl] glucosamine N-acyltransferase